MGRSCRLPAGHPEAFFEAFANVYRFAFDAMVERAEGKKIENGKVQLKGDPERLGTEVPRRFPLVRASHS